MTKTKLIALIAGTVVLVTGATVTTVALVGNHEHTYSTEWSYDETNHWHAATCKHKDEVADKTSHIWDSGIIETEQTCTVAGVKKYTCTVCGAIKNESIPASHTLTTYYTAVKGEESTVGKYDKCLHCEYVGADVTPITDYTLLTASEVGMTTFEKDKVYVVTENYTANITISAENVVLLGVKTITPGVGDAADEVSYLTSGGTITVSETAKNFTISGFDLGANKKIDVNADTNIINCVGKYANPQVHKSDVKLVVAGCSFGNDTYGLYANFDPTVSGVDFIVSDNVFTNIATYCIFIYGNADKEDATKIASFKNITVAQNTFNGWGEKAKRATIKTHFIKGISEVLYDPDTTDITLLTEEAKAFVRKVLASGNVYNRSAEHPEVSVFNIDGIYFNNLVVAEE